MRLFNKENLYRLRPYIYLSLVYAVVHSFLLLNKSFFWDDWIWMQNPAEHRIALDELGIVFFKPFLHDLIQWPLFYIKLYVFLCNLAAGLLFYKSLKILKIADSKMTLLASCLFLLLPYNIFGRSTICTVQNSLSTVLFFLGYLSYLKFRKNINYLYLLTSVVVFTFSFNTPSFLILYIALLFCTEMAYSKSPKGTLKKLALVAFATIVHAALYFAAKNHFVPVQGIYADYNKVSFAINNLIRLILDRGAYVFFNPVTFSIFGKDLANAGDRVLVVIYSITFYAPIFLFYRRKDYKNMWLSAAGAGLVLAAIFPYIAVGKMPTTYSWDTRHQLLLPLGASIWFLSFFNLLSSYKIKNILMIGLVFACGIGSVRMYLSVQGLRYHDLAIQNEFRKLMNSKQTAAYVLSERAHPPGVMEQEWNFYELTGMAYKVLGTQSNFVILASHIGTFNVMAIPESFGNYKNRYMVSQAKWAEPFYCLKIHELVHMNELRSLSILIDEFFYPKIVFEEKINNIYHLEKTAARTQNGSFVTCDHN